MHSSYYDINTSIYPEKYAVILSQAREILYCHQCGNQRQRSAQNSDSGRALAIVTIQQKNVSKS